METDRNRMEVGKHPLKMMVTDGVCALSKESRPTWTKANLWMAYTRPKTQPSLLFFPKQFTVGFSLKRKGWPRYALTAPPELVPSCVRHVSASCPFVRLVCPVSAMGLRWPRLQTLFAMGPPCIRSCVHFGRTSKPCLPRVRLAFCPPPCVRYHVSAKALALPLDFARSWPVVGQGRSIIR